MALATVFAALEETMRNLVVRIAEGEGLDADELIHKYLGPDVKSAPAPKKRAAKVTVTEVTKCTAKTAKGKPCSLKALEGMCFCRVHISKAEESDEGSASVGPVKKKPASRKGKERATEEEEEEDEAGPSTSTKKPKKKKKKVSGPPPMHTHPVDDETHDDCELCHTHGSAIDDTEAAEGFEMVVSPPRTLRERLVAVAAAAVDEEDDYDEE
jgi:hypothetical protein